MPVEHFAEEAPSLLPLPTTPYDPPQWSAPVVGRDQHAEVDYALYSLPASFCWMRSMMIAMCCSFVTKLRLSAGTVSTGHQSKPAIHSS